jgi:hypothetical protein
MVLFRLVIAPEIACFIGFFGNWPPFLRILQIRPPNAVLANACFTKMRCWHLRPGRDFARTFAHHFGVVFGLVFEYFFGPAEERRFAGISVFFGFGVLARTCF